MLNIIVIKCILAITNIRRNSFVLPVQLQSQLTIKIVIKPQAGFNIGPFSFLGFFIYCRNTFNKSVWINLLITF